MQLSSSEPCVVILTEKEVEVSVNNHATFTLPKNYLAAFACNNNVIELSTLNHVLIPTSTVTSSTIICCFYLCKALVAAGNPGYRLS